MYFNFILRLVLSLAGSANKGKCETDILLLFCTNVNLLSVHQLSIQYIPVWFSSRHSLSQVRVQRSKSPVSTSPRADAVLVSSVRQTFSSHRSICITVTALARHRFSWQARTYVHRPRDHTAGEWVQYVGWQMHWPPYVDVIISGIWMESVSFSLSWNVHTVYVAGTPRFGIFSLACELRRDLSPGISPLWMWHWHIEAEWVIFVVQPDLACTVRKRVQLPAFQFILCRQACAGFLSSCDRIITHVRTLSLAVGKCALGTQGSRDARERRYRRAWHAKGRARGKGVQCRQVVPPVSERNPSNCPLPSAVERSINESWYCCSKLFM